MYLIGNAGQVSVYGCSMIWNRVNGVGGGGALGAQGDSSFEVENTFIVGYMALEGEDFKLTYS